MRFCTQSTYRVLWRCRDILILYQHLDDRKIHISINHHIQNQHTKRIRHQNPHIRWYVVSECGFRYYLEIHHGSGEHRVASENEAISVFDEYAAIYAAYDILQVHKLAKLADGCRREEKENSRERRFNHHFLFVIICYHHSPPGKKKSAAWPCW